MKAREGFKGTLVPTADERGGLLVVGLLVIVLLSLLGATFLATSSTEFMIASNDVNAAKAFSLAEAGTALAIRTLKNTGNWDTVLLDPDPAVDPSVACPALVPPGDGGCTYRIENDVAEAATPKNDTNRIVVVKSKGTYKAAAKEVHLAFTWRPISAGPGGINSSGIGATLDYAGADNAIDGNNWVPPSDDGTIPAVQNNNACGPGTGPKFGIAVPNTTQQAALKAAAEFDGQQGSITGAAPNPPWSPPSPTPSIGVASDLMTLAQLQALADSLSAQAQVTYTPGTILTDVTMSTQAAPKISTVQCAGYTGTTCLKLDGTTKGAGVLIVMNGTLHMRATASWVGLIVLVGANVQFDTGGGGGPGNIVFGQVYIGESTAVQPQWYRPRNTKLRYSCDGLRVANAAAGFPSATTKEIVWWKQHY